MNRKRLPRQFTLSPEVLNIIDDIADYEGLSASACVENLLRRHIRENYDEFCES